MPTRLGDAELADEAFFALPRHQARNYRIRMAGDGLTFVVVRRKSGVFLRVDLGASLPKGVDQASESAAEALWWERAWPDADPGLRRSAMRRARNGGAP